MSQNSRPRPGARDGAGGGEEGVRAGDDLVARADLQRHQRQQQCIGAGGDADAELALAVGRDVLLELVTAGPEDEALAGADLLYGRLDLGGQRRYCGLRSSSGTCIVKLPCQRA